MDKALCLISSAGPCELNLNWVVDIKVTAEFQRTISQIRNDRVHIDLENLKSLQLSGNFRDPGFLTHARRVSA